MEKQRRPRHDRIHDYLLRLHKKMKISEIPLSSKQLTSILDISETSLGVNLTKTKRKLVEKYPYIKREVREIPCIDPNSEYNTVPRSFYIIDEKALKKCSSKKGRG